VYNLLIACLETREFGMLRHYFLLMPGVLDVLPINQPRDQRVLMGRSKYLGQSCMLMAATKAHMEVMRELMIRYEKDSKCNTISSFRAPALPWIIADEAIDEKTKMKTKMVKVPVPDEVGLSEC
jgi:hypothetical protein